MNLWESIWKQFKKHPLGLLGLVIVVLYSIVGVYAPLFASSKPLFVIYNGEWFFPLFRYLFFPGFFTKGIDLFFNLLMFTLPLFLILPKRGFYIPLLIQIGGFAFLLQGGVKDPSTDPEMERAKNQLIQARKTPLSFEESLSFLPSYGRLNLALNGPQGYEEKQAWVKKQHLTWLIHPLIRPFHWEEDAGGNARQNRQGPWYEQTRIVRKDLVAALIFGIRISLVVGLLSVTIALLIGVPIGAWAGYYGGSTDILISRFLEIWESMPVFFMLLLIVAFLQSKSIFLIILAIGLFSWTTFSRYIRGEFFKQRALPYVEALKSMRFSDSRIVFSHILPNAIPPLLTLLPFAIMGAITAEASLSFLGLGEEGSSSWGVLMDEGRSVFPAEASLLWPPAILLTILLIAIALVGDALRDALDPKLRRS